MAQVIAEGEGERFSLPGRDTLEIVSSHINAAGVTLRLVEIPVPAPGEAPRAPHVHHGFEEVIQVVSGEGTTHSGSNAYPLKAGDTILIPAEEPHATRNTGTTPLILRCFFPVNDIRPGTEQL